MSIELDGVKLISHVRDPETGATKELRSVRNISIGERRIIVEHRVPGLEGGILQDLGRVPVRISFDGMIFGDQAKDGLEIIRSKFKAGQAFPFNSSLTGIAEVTQVLIEDLSVDETSSVSNGYRYSITLREYSLPPEEEEPPSQEEEAKESVDEASEDALTSVNYITGRVLDGNGEPVRDVDVKITWEGGEFSLKTDEEGVYRKDNLEPGKYTVTVDSPGYEDKKREVEIKSSK